jgi:TatA/E family protein of Tat protein translocase
VFNIGPTELIVILVIALLVVGPKRLPEVGKTIGKSLREFRRAQEDLKDSFNFDLDDSKSTPPAARRTAASQVQPAPDSAENEPSGQPDRNAAE